MKSTFTTLFPTIGQIHNNQFDENIRTVVLSSCTGLTMLHGASLMLDEIVLEEKAVHFHKYNKIGGLYWKHSHSVDPVLCTYNSAVSIAQKIHDGEVHLGKELIVIGVIVGGQLELTLLDHSGYVLLMEMLLDKQQVTDYSSRTHCPLSPHWDGKIILDFDFKHIFKHNPDNYLICEAQWIHKQTICWLVINKDFVLKSLN
ncbi:hypothetical protein DFH29DRAFT_883228 [Suillus ampliporus]|nr:hypothetical protein DFH29DRAFT_883228 [Suillus ampliporus]